MKRWTKTAVCALLSLLCIFSCIGYAALSSSLMIQGTVDLEAVEPEGLYISKVEVVERIRVSDNAAESIILPTNLKSNLSISSPNASITYAITVHNKTDMTYWFLGTRMDDQTVNGNGAIKAITTKDSNTADSSAFDVDDWVPPQTERTFYATYTFNQNVNGNITTLVNFDFGLKVESFSDGFLKVLNTPSLYNSLVDEFENEYTSNNGSTVLGNVGSDKAFFDSLFENDIAIEVNGESIPVTIMVARRNVDARPNHPGTNTGDTYEANPALAGCEYTVYVTADTLEPPGAPATVYAISYTCDPNGVWRQIGQLYEGTATVIEYDTTNQGYEGAFDVDTWVVNEGTYVVIPHPTDPNRDLKYGVGSDYPGGEQFDKYETLEELMSMPDESIFNDLNNNMKDFIINAYAIVYIISKQNNQVNIALNTQNVGKQGYENLKLACDKLVPYSKLHNGHFEGLQESLRQLSRAELITMLEELYETYTYYKSVNP